MIQDPPYFLENEAWFTWSRKTHRYHLTEFGRTIPKVLKSFEEFYAVNHDEDGNIVDS